MAGLRRGGVCAAVACFCAVAPAQTAEQIIREAVGTELYAAAHDHSCWMYYEVDSKPNATVKQWVSQTHEGGLDRVLSRNGQSFSLQQERDSMNAYIGNPSAQAKRRRSGQHDDQQAAQLLNMLPQAFDWTIAGKKDGNTVLHFAPNPQFNPPSWQAKVFAAMGGEVTVNDAQHRIVSLKGHMLHDVRFWGGLFGDLKAGGWFDVERREVGGSDWQIVATHVHIQGHALIFHTISEEEDDVKSKFTELPGNIDFKEAEKDLMEQKP
ncbi:MAG TPA: hypothetical protein VMA34_03140 [Terracidiphilus sp.]|nr:hypothetical protein [Terracidiphilus sp.]